MDNFARRPEFVMIRLPRGASLSAGGARLLTAYVRRRRGGEGWRLAAVDAFCSPGGTLLLARPSEIRVAGIAGAALPFLYKYFTE